MRWLVWLQARFVAVSMTPNSPRFQETGSTKARALILHDHRRSGHAAHSSILAILFRDAILQYYSTKWLYDWRESGLLLISHLFIFQPLVDRVLQFTSSRVLVVCSGRCTVFTMVHLSEPAPDTGVFHTDEVRPRNKPSKSTSRTIALPGGPDGPYYKSPPNLAAGFQSLELSHEANVRANLVADEISNSQFRITLETWGGSKLYSAGATWLEHKAEARDCLFGQFDTHDIARTSKDGGSGVSKASAKLPQPENAQSIKFPRAFKEQPEVVCWMNRIDMATGDDRNWRIRVYASNVTTKGFTAHIDTWSDSILHGAAMCWIAFPKKKAHVASGSFNTMDVRSWSNPKPNNSARVKFDQGLFSKPPTVLVALNMLDMAGNADLRIKTYVDEVSKDGFRWHLDTWDDSTLYAAGASWIALGYV